ncbi:MAG: T9SS type A sorting domain-containing protein, partial [Candidatus Kapaibacterium sp.]
MNQLSTSRNDIINVGRLRRMLLAIIALFFISIPSFAGPIISIHIGRPSRDCAGFGFCRIVSTPQGTVDPSAITAEGTLAGKQLTLAFREKPHESSDILPIDNPLQLDAETSRMLGARSLTILPGQYQVDYTANPNGTVTVPVQRVGITITIEVGRKSRGCTGFGICSITVGTSALDNPARAIATASGDVLTLDMPESSSGVKEDMLTIDEDIVLDDATSRALGSKRVTIPAGTYPVDYTSSPNGTVNLPMQRFGFTVEVQIGRPSRNCTGVGICSIKIGLGIDATNADRTVPTIASLDSGKMELAFQRELPEQSDLFTIDADFQVDSAIARKFGAGNLVIKHGAYQISRTSDGRQVVVVDVEQSGIVINIRFGRRSRGCSGFGICSIKIGVDGTDATERAIGTVNGNTLHIDFLTKPQGAESVLPIDEEITLDQATATALGKRGLMVIPGQYRVDYSGNPNGSVNLGIRSLGITIDVNIGRRSRDCQGFGICGIVISADLASSTDRTIPTIGTLGNGTLNLLFTRELPEQGDVLTIDEDITLDPQVAKSLGSRSVTVKKGSYQVIRDAQGHQTVNVDVARFGIGVTIYIGRPATNCSGSGFCKIVISIDLAARAIPATVIPTGNGTFDVQLLDRSPEQDSTIHIDNALELDSATAAALGVTTILPGEYPISYDSNANGNLHIRGRSAGTNGVATASAANGAAIALPNPVGGTGTIRFTVRKSGPVTVTLTDANGRQVARLLNGRTMEAGNGEVNFNAAGLPSGSYYFSISTA